ncbi:MAG: cyclic pyranopterin monophosphate synthase MoaC [Desulfobacteraceae bacterium]|nr:cyclic pyranopterin monophosphate synthase MoaC [Desulfobacteraceae bacterium]MBC2757628.1 cyclic pyranopterin monophosphate synthase MoaC [Desulfobacteraceae bacterium]
MSDFTHLDEKGHVRMVDVSGKAPTDRVAVAQAKISMTAQTFFKIVNNDVRKGNVLETARIAGIMAAKKTPDLIPMCHPLNIGHVQVDFSPDEENNTIAITASVRILDRTGVEMEALTAVSVAALTIYDMCKSHDRAMVISDICLKQKSGGKSGTYIR